MDKTSRGRVPSHKVKTVLGSVVRGRDAVSNSLFSFIKYASYRQAIAIYVQVKRNAEMKVIGSFISSRG